MGDFFKKLDEIMTGDLVRRIGGAVCVIAVILVGIGFLVGAKSVLSTMKGSGTAVVATDETAAEDEAASEEAEEAEDEEEDYEDEEAYDEE